MKIQEIAEIYNQRMQKAKQQSKESKKYKWLNKEKIKEINNLK